MCYQIQLFHAYDMDWETVLCDRQKINGLMQFIKSMKHWINETKETNMYQVEAF